MKTLFKMAATMLVLVPTTSIADTYACTFDTECFDAEACNSTTYELEFKLDGIHAHVGDQVSGFVGLSLAPDVGFMTNETGKSYTILTVAGGVARYTIQDIENEYTILYIGSCEATE